MVGQGVGLEQECYGRRVAGQRSGSADEGPAEGGLDGDAASGGLGFMAGVHHFEHMEAVFGVMSPGLPVRRDSATQAVPPTQL